MEISEVSRCDVTVSTDFMEMSVTDKSKLSRDVIIYVTVINEMTEDSSNVVAT